MNYPTVVTSVTEEDDPAFDQAIVHDNEELNYPTVVTSVTEEDEEDLKKDIPPPETKVTVEELKEQESTPSKIIVATNVAEEKSEEEGHVLL